MKYVIWGLLALVALQTYVIRWYQDYVEELRNSRNFNQKIN